MLSHLKNIQLLYDTGIFWQVGHQFNGNEAVGDLQVNKSQYHTITISSNIMGWQFVHNKMVNCMPDFNTWVQRKLYFYLLTGLLLPMHKSYIKIYHNKKLCNYMYIVTFPIHVYVTKRIFEEMCMAHPFVTEYPTQRCFF